MTTAGDNITKANIVASVIKVFNEIMTEIRGGNLSEI